jgi:hypothetical protein
MQCVENRPVIESVSTPELIAPETAKQYVLTEENGPKEVDRFVWSAAKYSDNVVVEYTLLMDKRMVILQMLKLLQLAKYASCDSCKRLEPDCY